jgi:hypothetical protein
MQAATASFWDINNRHIQANERHQPRSTLEGAATDRAVDKITSTTSTETETPSCYISDNNANTSRNKHIDATNVSTDPGTSTHKASLPGDAQSAYTPTYTPNPDYKWGTFYTGEYTPTPHPISTTPITTAESDYETANEDLHDWEEGPIVQSIESDARDMYVTPDEIRPVPKRAWNKIRNKDTRQQAKWLDTPCPVKSGREARMMEVKGMAQLEAEVFGVMGGFVDERYCTCCHGVGRLLWGKKRQKRKCVERFEGFEDVKARKRARVFENRTIWGVEVVSISTLLNSNWS